MSKIGKRPVAVPKGVTVTVADGRISVKGPRGLLVRAVPSTVAVRVEGAEARVEKIQESREAAMAYGSTRAHLANMVKGVSEGFTKVLEMKGVGYRAQKTKKDGKEALQLSLGFSHMVDYVLPEGVKVDIPEPTKMVISGNDAETVGRVAMELKTKYRPPEPYKGKGIRYEGEKVRQKAGKAAGK